MIKNKSNGKVNGGEHENCEAINCNLEASEIRQGIEANRVIIEITQKNHRRG